MTVADIAELHKSIAIARYALEHVAARIECKDVDNADQALTKAAHIIYKLLGEVCGQEKQREQAVKREQWAGPIPEPKE